MAHLVDQCFGLRNRGVGSAHRLFACLAGLALLPGLMVKIHVRVGVERTLETATRQAQRRADAGAAAKDEQDVRVLELGKPIQRELAGGQRHSYQIALSAGQYVNVIVEQRGIDLLVTLNGPDGEKLVEVDSPNGTQGPELVSLVAEVSGVYRLDVRPLDKAAAGSYEALVKELRDATLQDRTRGEAERGSAEGDRLREQNSEELLHRAIEKYKASLHLWRAASDMRGEAATLGKLAVTYHDLGDIQKALEHYRLAIALWRTMGNRREEAETLTSIGYVHTMLGEYQKTLESYNQALALQREAGDRAGEAHTLRHVGGVYSALGEKQKALGFYHQALVLHQTASDRRGEAITLNIIGMLHSSSGEYQKALDFYNRALALLRASSNSGDRGAEAIILSAIGSVYRSLGEYQKAVDSLNQSLQLSRAARNRYAETHTLNAIAKNYSSLGDYPNALEFYHQELAIWRELGDRWGEAATLRTVGAVYLGWREPERSLEPLHQAIQIFRTMGDRRQEAETRYDLARVERERGNPQEARAHIEDALKLVEAMRIHVSSQRLRASFSATMQDYREFHIGLIMQLHQQDPLAGHAAAALQASERARARSLLELLTEARADIRQGVDPVLLERERTLQQQLNTKAEQLLRLLRGRHGEENAESIRKEIEALTTQHQEVEARIRVNSPRYAALTQPQPLSLSEIQQQVLDADTLLLEYALGKERSYLWAVTHTSITSYELPKRKEIEAEAQRVYELFSTNSSQAQNAGADAATALSQLLLGPVAEQLVTSRLVLVVADGALQYLPFGALPLPHPKAGRSVPSSQASQVPLIVQHEVVSLPSASTLAVLRREQSGRKPGAKLVAVLADPVFDRNDPRVKPGGRDQSARERNPGSRRTDPQPASQLPSNLERSARESGVMSFDRLRSTRREAETIAALTREGERLEALDFEASRATATSDRLNDYRIVHFATHGLLNSQHPELSGVVLSLVDEQGQAQNGFLPGHEIYNLKLNADLVVLSGCQTALGKEVRGEGLLGLTRGFMYAGAPRVVASLWRVSDKATADLMKEFYIGVLRKGLRPAAALRAAQIAMWKEKRAPYFWAAFVLQGEWR